MKIDNHNITVSSVDMEERKNLGIKTGDTVRVWVKIEEKGKTRLQAFEGLVLAVKHGGEPGGTFTVRKVASGVGVEKIFPLYSPSIDKIEIVKRARVRRSKLYMLRDKVAREVKRILRRAEQVLIATKGSAELEEERRAAEAKQAEIDAAAQKAEEEAKAQAEAEEEASKTDEEVTEVTQDVVEDDAAVEAKTEEEAKEEKKEDVPAEDKQDDEKENEEK